MDAHRLRWVLDRIVGEHARLGIDHRFAQIIQALDGCVSSPGAASDGRFRTGLVDLMTALNQSRTNDFVESERRILREIQGDPHTGQGLARRLQEIISEQPFLPGWAGETIGGVAADVQKFMGVCAAAVTALEAMNINRPDFGAEEYELGILLPEKIVKGDPDRILAELKDWNAVLRDLVRVVSQQEPRVVLRSYTAQRFELAAKLDRAGALALGTVIAGIYAMYEQVKANRDRAADLERRHYPPEIVRRVKECEPQLVSQAMAATREKLRSKLPRSAKGRARELERRLTRSLRFLTSRMSEGVEIEIVGPPAAGDRSSASQADRAVPHQVRQALHLAGGSPSADQEQGPARIPLSMIARDAA